MKAHELEIMSRDTAAEVSRIMGPSSAAAAALRALEAMGDDAVNFEICRHRKSQMLVLIGKEFLERPEIEVTRPRTSS